MAIAQAWHARAAEEIGALTALSALVAFQYEYRVGHGVGWLALGAIRPGAIEVMKVLTRGVRPRSSVEER